MKRMFGALFSKDSTRQEGGMSVEELVSLFPEIPKDLHREPVLVQFAATFADLLRIARDPSACSSQHDAPNQYYLKLIGPLKIYMYALSTKDKVLSQLQGLLDTHAADPEGFAASLVPDDAPGSEVKGPGCQ